MDYLDIAKGADTYNSTLTRLYIVSTVTFAVALLASLRKTRQKQALPYPQNIITFALVNGIIFRAVSWVSLSDWESNRGNLLTSYDYARIFFFTISDLTIHLIPIVTAHRLLSYRNQSSFQSGLPGFCILVSYFITFVIFALNLVCMGIGSTVPWNQQVAEMLFSISDSAPPLATFSNLMNASAMLYWIYVVAYIVLLIEYYNVFRWSYLVYCILMIVSQFVLTILSFLPQLNGLGGIMVKCILQFIFVMQFEFISLMLATSFAYQWLPPPRDLSDEEELPNINSNH